MAFIDYYKILGVDRNIPQKDVRAAYRKRAKLFHPDLHPNDPKAKAKFQALNEAYDVISDPEKRAKYDKYGEQWRQADAFQGNDTEGFRRLRLQWLWEWWWRFLQFLPRFVWRWSFSLVWLWCPATTEQWTDGSKGQH